MSSESLRKLRWVTKERERERERERENRFMNAYTHTDTHIGLMCDPNVLSFFEATFVASVGWLFVCVCE